VDRANTGLDNDTYPDPVYWDPVKKEGIVRELKSNDLTTIKKGLNQVKKYADQLQKQYGGHWKIAVDTYVKQPSGTFKYSFGTPLKYN
jgi:hypothetical protein